MGAWRKTGETLVRRESASQIKIIITDTWGLNDALNILQFVLVLLVASIPVAMPAVFSFGTDRCNRAAPPRGSIEAMSFPWKTPAGAN
jgi:hypothetical protein